MVAYQTILRGGNILGHGAGDIAVLDGKIVKIAPGIEGAAQQEYDAGGGLVIPSFVDAHTHLDKVLVPPADTAYGLMDAVAMGEAYQRSVPLAQVARDVKRRAKTVVEWEIVAGTGLIKNHVIVDGIWGIEALRGMQALREEFAGRVDIQSIATWRPALKAQLDEALKAGWIDFLGGFPSVTADPKAAVDELFRLALEKGLPLDLHVDESDVPDITCFEYILEKTIEHGMQGRVNCSHVTALALVDDDRARRAIERAKEAQVNIITLPGCNLYLMGRGGPQPGRRGITRVEEFLKAGVNVALASDNIRDAFRPFGNGDMLQEANLTAQLLQYGTATGFETVLRMATENAAKTCMVQGYGLAEGNNADLVVLDAANATDAVVGMAKRRLVFKRGALVARDGRLIS